MPNVVMISPGFPLEMAYFTRALAEVGATVIGVGDQPVNVLPDEAKAALAHYEHVSLADEGAVLAALQGLSRHVRIDQVECLWEPYMVLAARIRETLGLPGMTVEQTLPFRDKELMKQVLDAAGIRTPRHASTSTIDLRESLDHVLVSEQFYDNSRRRLWLFDGLIINNDHLNDDDHRATGSSDHGQVKVRLRWKPYR